MLKTFDYRCDACGSKFDAFVKSADQIVKCRCGQNARRIISPVRSKLDPVSGHFPGATDKWLREHEKAGRRTSEMDFNK